MAKYLVLAREGTRNEELAMKLDRLSNSPDAAERYKKAAETLNNAAASCSMENASKAASDFAKTAEHFAAAVFPDTSGKAIVLYKKAISIFSQAAAACPEGHCNKGELESHIGDIEVRIMYLESLNGSPPTIAIEDHIGKLCLSTEEAVIPNDIVHTESPVLDEVQGKTTSEQEVAVPPAPSSVTEVISSSSPHDSVTAPCSLEAEKGQTQPTVQASLDLEGNKSDGPRRLSDKEFLNRAVEMEREGHALESKGDREQALKTFTNCLELYGILQKREKNQKVRDCMRTRMAALLDHAEVLKAKITLGTT